MQALITPQQALKHLRYISQIEEIVNLGGRRQELLHHIFVHLHSGLGHKIAKRFELIVELLQLLVNHGAEYAAHFALLRERHVNEIKS